MTPKLTKIQARVLRLRLYGASWEKVGKCMGVTEDRARHYGDTADRKLYNILLSMMTPSERFAQKLVEEQFENA